VSIKHLIFLALVIVGALYVWHTYSMHGGVAGFKAGVGLGK